MFKRAIPFFCLEQLFHVKHRTWAGLVYWYSVMCCVWYMVWHSTSHDMPSHAKVRITGIRLNALTKH